MKHTTTNLTVLIMVIIASVLSVLALTTARAQLKVARRFAEYVSLTQECTNEANEWLASVNRGGANLNVGDTISRDYTDGEGHFLKISLQKLASGVKINQWVYWTQWTDDVRTEHYIQEKTGDIDEN